MVGALDELLDLVAKGDDRAQGVLLVLRALPDELLGIAEASCTNNGDAPDITRAGEACAIWEGRWIGYHVGWSSRSERVARSGRLCPTRGDATLGLRVTMEEERAGNHRILCASEGVFQCSRHWSGAGGERRVGDVVMFDWAAADT